MGKQRVMLTVAYDGTAYSGFQIQNNAKTIEGELSTALEGLLGEKVQIMGGSRTDAGVHALCNVAVFDTSARIPAEKISYALNQRLPEDIRIRDSREVAADFHPRHCESRKIYEYRITNTRFPIPTRRLYSYFTYTPLCVERMQEAAGYLVGTHDFKSFCSAGSQVESTVRTVYSIDVSKEGEEILIRIQGNGFLYNMVRIIAGTLMEVGKGRWEPEKVREILQAEDRQAAGPTAPGCGLMLAEYRLEESCDPRR